MIFLGMKSFNASLNETYICLIPKKVDAKRVGDYGPISLTTCLYKVNARVLSERLKRVLPYTTMDHQFAFVANRQILIASLIANKIIDESNRKKRSGMVIKLDIEKAFDMVVLDFLENILQAKGFGLTWRKWIRGCTFSANFSFIINGKPRGKIRASSGLCQGDPLSPFLFILVINCLSRMLILVKQNGLVDGFHVGKDPHKISITHLQFADDTILFFSPKEDHLRNLLHTIHEFEAASMNLRQHPWIERNARVFTDKHQNAISFF